MTSLTSWLAAGLVLATATAAASAQSAHPVSVGASYSYVRSNILPSCSCVSLNGGSAELQVGLSSHLAVRAEASVTHQEGITPDGYSLTQFISVVGLRYSITPPSARWRPFVEAAAGGANAFGSLAPAQTGLGSNSHAFAFQTGGGLEIALRGGISLVPVRVDYLLTTFRNGSANRQDDLQVSAGVRFRIGR